MNTFNEENNNDTSIDLLWSKSSTRGLMFGDKFNLSPQQIFMVCSRGMSGKFHCRYLGLKWSMQPGLTNYIINYNYLLLNIPQNLEIGRETKDMKKTTFLNDIV